MATPLRERFASGKGALAGGLPQQTVRLFLLLLCTNTHGLPAAGGPGATRGAPAATAA